MNTRFLKPTKPQWIATAAISLLPLFTGSAQAAGNSGELGSTCGSGKVRDASGQCVSGCFIDGSLRSHGDVHPSNPCLACTAANTWLWSNREIENPGSWLLTMADCDIDSAWYQD